MRRFLSDISHEDFVFDNNYAENQMFYHPDLIKMMSNGEKDIEKNYRIFVAIGFGAGQALQHEMEHGLNFTYKELHEKMVHLYVFMLNLKWDKEKIQNYIIRSNDLCEQFFERYPHLTDTKNYLYQSKFQDKSIIDNLLEL